VLLASSASSDFSRTTTFSGGLVAGAEGVAAEAACSTCLETSCTMATDLRTPSSFRSSV
jgi:hypothetical protein